MLTPLGQITPVCIRTFSLSDKYHYFADVISFQFNQSYIQCFQKFTKSAQCSSFKQDYYGVGIHLVVCPLMALHHKSAKGSKWPGIV